MKSQPLISIGLCTYNGEAFLQEQLESLVNQTYRPIEIRIRDDQSTDLTGEIIREFQHAYSFIHFIQNPVRLGFQKNFESVFQDCEGEFIAPCDQDDAWKSDKLEKLVQTISVHQMVYHDSELIDESGKLLGYRISDKFQLGEWTQQTPFLFFNCISGHSMLFRKSLLDTALPIPEAGFYDHWLAWVALENGTIGYCPEALVKYRQHSSNQTDLVGKTHRLSGWDRASNRVSRENNWLEVCSEIKESSYFSLKLGWEIWQHRNFILQILPYSTLAKLAFSLRYSIGLKSKKLFYTLR
jgi:glycosyltransferase involved in cell wall biosynthesis